MEPRIALTHEIEELARMGAWFAYSVSGGKDSGASMHSVNTWLDSIGHPAERRIALHADLGRAEWSDTLDTVRAVAAHVGTPLEVVSQKNDLVWRLEDRWRRSLLRYAALETINLVPPWPSSSLLFCRSEQKLVPLSRRKASLPGGLPVVGVVGIRREESPRRAKAEVVSPDLEMKRRNGREGLLWNPIIDWTAQEVMNYHERHGIPLHRAYRLGSTRLSCALCAIASRHDLLTSIHKGGNLKILQAYSSLELKSAFSFQPATWISDLAPDGMVSVRQLAEAKRIATERQEAQALIPRHVLRAKSIRNIVEEDAVTLATVRKRISNLYGIVHHGTSAEEILQLSKGLMVHA